MIEESTREAFEKHLLGHWLNNGECKYRDLIKIDPEGEYKVQDAQELWTDWRAACNWQKEQDIKICKKLGEDLGDGYFNYAANKCGNAIKNQKELLDNAKRK